MTSMYAKNVVLDEHGQARVKITPTEEGPIPVDVFDKYGNPVKSQLIFAFSVSEVGTPTGLSAEPGHHMLMLRWNAITDPDLAGYNVYQLIDGRWTRINESVITDAAYDVLNLDLGIAYQFCVSAVTAEGLESSKSRPISYTLKVPDDLTPPTVAASIPYGNAREVNVNSPISVIFSEDLLQGPEYDDITLTVEGVAVPFIMGISRNTLTIIPNERLPYSAVCILTVPAGAVLDLGGNSLEREYTVRFTTEGPPDTEPPEIIASAPAPDEVGVAVDRQIFIILSENVVEGTAFDGIIVSAGGTSVSADAALSGNILIITPAEDLAHQTTYDVIIPANAVADIAGNLLASQHSFSFITRPAPDVVPPVVAATYPSDSAVDVPLMPTIRIAFSELIEEELLVIPTLKLNDTPVEITIRIGEILSEGTEEDPPVIDYSVLIITPTAPLDAGALYRVTIPAGAVRDPGGNAMASPYEFAFTTIRGPDNVAPRALSSDPADNEQQVPVASEINIYFSESVRPAEAYSQITFLLKSPRTISATSHPRSMLSYSLPETCRTPIRPKYTRQIRRTELSAYFLMPKYTSFLTN